MEATAVVTGKILPRSRLRWIRKTYGRMWAVKIVVVRAVYRAFRRCEARFTEGAYSLTALAYSARILWRAWDLISYKKQVKGVSAVQIAHSLQNRPRRRAKPTTQARTTRIRCLRASRRRSGYIVVDDASGERDIPSKRADPRPAPVAVKFGILASTDRTAA